MRPFLLHVDWVVETPAPRRLCKARAPAVVRRAIEAFRGRGQVGVLPCLVYAWLDVDALPGRARVVVKTVVRRGAGAFPVAIREFSLGERVALYAGIRDAAAAKVARRG